jgi:hypothetical protein
MYVLFFQNYLLPRTSLVSFGSTWSWVLNQITALIFLNLTYYSVVWINKIDVPISQQTTWLIYKITNKYIELICFKTTVVLNQ